MTTMEPRGLGRDPGSNDRDRVAASSPAVTSYVQAMDGVRLTPEQKEDLVNSILTQYAAEPADAAAVAFAPRPVAVAGSSAAVGSHGAARSSASSTAPRFSRRRFVTLLSAAAVGAGVAGIAFAASQAQVSVPDILETFFGGSSSGSGSSGTGGGAAGGAEGAGVGFGTSVGASATSDGVTVTVDSVVGDASNAAIVVTIQREDGSDLGVSRNPDTGEPQLWLAGAADSDGMYTQNLAIDGIASQTMGSFFYDADPSDAAVQVVLTVAAEDGESLVGKTAHLHFPDLRDSGDSDSGPFPEDWTVVAQGPWDIDFTFDYEDTACSYEAANETVTCENIDATLTSVRVSSIALALGFSVAVHAEAAESNLQQGTWEGEFLNLPVSLVMDDGEEVAAGYDESSTGPQLSGSASMSFDYSAGFDPADPEGDYEGTASRMVFLGSVIDPDRVVAVVIGDTRIELAPKE